MENNIKETWQKIYQEWFNLQKDFSKIKIPKIYDPEKYFAIILAQELTMNEIIIGIKKRFWLSVHRGPLWGYIGYVNEDIILSDRTAKSGDYSILFNKNDEADKELKNLSADLLKTVSHKGITFEERLLLEVLYFDRTGDHLDVENYTLCSGSRYSDGNVPVIHCEYDGIVTISSLGSNFSGDRFRSRSVVS